LTGADDEEETGLDAEAEEAAAAEESTADETVAWDEAAADEAATAELLVLPQPAANSITAKSPSDLNTLLLVIKVLLFKCLLIVYLLKSRQNCPGGQ
jgi:hypothetical protein